MPHGVLRRPGREQADAPPPLRPAGDARLTPAAFTGFPREGLAFLEELEENNDRDWFKANRERYDRWLAEPVRALGDSLSDLGRPHTFRPWNDTRFHQGPPIKEHLGLAIGYEGAGGYYVELSLDGVLVAAGMHQPTPDQVDRIRRALDDPRTARALRRAIETAEGQKLELNEPDLVRGPRGYAPDHPQMDLLKRRRITVARRNQLASWVHGRTAEKRIREQLEAATPVVRWLRDNVGPPQKGR